MKMFKKPKKWVILIIIFSVGSLALSQSDFYRKLGKSQRLINEVYKQVFATYVDELDPEAFTKASIRNITAALDPYTVYMEEDERDNINILAYGKYGGVGIQLGWRNKQLSVIAPMDGSPAKAAGILSGDIIIKVDDQNVEKLSLDEAAHLIRGERGTEVKLTIKRYGIDDFLDFSITRANIKVKDVTYSGLITPSTGYVRLSRFSRNAAQEMRSALTDLINQNVKEIIIDLRDNPGGLLNSAVSILDMLITEGQLLVTTKGRTKESNKTFYSKNDPIVPESINIAILINHGSASASEIVSGAIQDLDRGLILGQKSFGKGLVQSVYNLDKTKTLKITTAKYYIPSGRLIQKSDYIDTSFVLNKTQSDTLFKSINGRTVKGNGGITPDSIIDYGPLPVLTTEYWRRGFFFSFAQKYKPEYTSMKEVEADTSLLDKFSGFVADQIVHIQLPGEKELEQLNEKIKQVDSTNNQVAVAINDIKAFYNQRRSTLFQTEQDKIHQQLLIEFAGLLEGPAGRTRQVLKNDPSIGAAIDLMSDKLAYDSFLAKSITQTQN
ncbi:MAG: S41 family peptidase [Fidelibacterota bacterium]